MARGNYPACKAVTLVYEGGTSNHKSDPGGFTSRGVTAGAGRSYRKRMGLAPKAVNLWSAYEVDHFYRDDYWDGVTAELLPWGVDLATFDAGVNSGTSRGAKWLQRAAGAKPDGKVGPATLRVVALGNGKEIVQRLCGYRLSFVQGLGTFKVFGRGWSTRIAGIEAKGVAMWLTHSGMSKTEASVVLNHEAGKASGAAKGAAKAGAATGAASAGAGGTDLVSGGTGWLWVVGLVLVVASIGLLIRSRQNRARAEAYAVEAGL